MADSKFGRESKPFWIVISDLNGMAPFPVRHATEDSAHEEAKRLARGTTGKFYVFEAKGVAGRVDVVSHRFNDTEHCPF